MYNKTKTLQNTLFALNETYIYICYYKLLILLFILFIITYIDFGIYKTIPN